METTNGVWEKRPAPGILDRGAGRAAAGTPNEGLPDYLRRRRLELPTLKRKGGYFCGAHNVRAEGDIRGGCPLCRQETIRSAYRRLLDDVRALVDSEPLSADTAETLRGHLVQAPVALGTDTSQPEPQRRWTVHQPGERSMHFEKQREALAYVRICFDVAAGKLPAIEVSRDGKPLARFIPQITGKREELQ